MKHFNALQFYIFIAVFHSAYGCTQTIKAAYDAFCKMCLRIAIPPLTSYGSYIIVNQYYITLTRAIPLSGLYPVWAALIFNM